MIPIGEARELHGREALCALEDYFGLRRTRRELMVALWEELHEREMRSRCSAISTTRSGPLNGGW